MEHLDFAFFQEQLRRCEPLGRNRPRPSLIRRGWGPDVTSGSRHSGQDDLTRVVGMSG